MLKAAFLSGLGWSLSAEIIQGRRYLPSTVIGNMKLAGYPLRIVSENRQYSFFFVTKQSCETMTDRWTERISILSSRNPTLCGKSISKVIIHN